MFCPAIHFTPTFQGSDPCFMSNLNMGLHFSPYREMNLLRAMILPNNLCTSLNEVGVREFTRAFISAGFASIPLSETMNLRNLRCCTLNTHLSGLSRRPYLRNWAKISVTFWIRSCSSLLLIMTSSTYTSTFLPICSLNARSITFLYVALMFVRPNGNRM